MIDDHKSISHLTPEIQARKALYHILKCIHEDSRAGYYMGLGTESFALATEAVAALDKRNVKEVREHFAPIRPRDPVQEAKIQIAEERGERIVFDDDELKALEQIEALLDTLADDECMEAATTTRHNGFDLLQRAEHKERLASAAGSLKAKYSK